MAQVVLAYSNCATPEKNDTKHFSDANRQFHLNKYKMFE